MNDPSAESWPGDPALLRGTFARVAPEAQAPKRGSGPHYPADGVSEKKKRTQSPRFLQWNPNWQRCRSPPFLCPLMFTLGLLGLGSVGLRVQESPSVLCSSPAPSLTPGLSSSSKELHSGLRGWDSHPCCFSSLGQFTWLARRVSLPGSGHEHGALRHR